MKNKLLFIFSLIFSFLIFIHLLIIGFTCESTIIVGEFNNGKVSSIDKNALLICIGILLIFCLSIFIISYIKEKKININLFIAYIILEIMFNILPYFSI